MLSPEIIPSRSLAAPQLMVKLTDKKIKWAVKQVINKCESTVFHWCMLIDWLDYEGTQVIAYEDDTSRKILSIGELPMQLQTTP